MKPAEHAPLSFPVATVTTMTTPPSPGCDQCVGSGLGAYDHVHRVHVLPGPAYTPARFATRGYALWLVGPHSDELRVFFPDREAALTFGRLAKMSPQFTHYELTPAVYESVYDELYGDSVRTLHLRPPEYGGG